jgi:hypothetical protein
MAWSPWIHGPVLYGLGVLHQSQRLLAGLGLQTLPRHGEGGDLCRAQVAQGGVACLLCLAPNGRLAASKKNCPDWWKRLSFEFAPTPALMVQRIILELVMPSAHPVPIAKTTWRSRRWSQDDTRWPQDAPRWPHDNQDTCVLSAQTNAGTVSPRDQSKIPKLYGWVVGKLPCAWRNNLVAMALLVPRHFAFWRAQRIYFAA